MRTHPWRLRNKKEGTHLLGALFYLAAAAGVVVAAAAVAAVVGSSQTVAAAVAAAAEQQNQNDDPPAAIPTETIVTHNKYLRNLVAVFTAHSKIFPGEYFVQKRKTADIRKRCLRYAYFIRFSSV